MRFLFIFILLVGSQSFCANAVSLAHLNQVDLLKQICDFKQPVRLQGFVIPQFNNENCSIRAFAEKNDIYDPGMSISLTAPKAKWKPLKPYHCDLADKIAMGVPGHITAKSNEDNFQVYKDIVFAPTGRLKYENEANKLNIIQDKKTEQLKAVPVERLYQALCKIDGIRYSFEAVLQARNVISPVDVKCSETSPCCLVAGVEVLAYNETGQIKLKLPPDVKCTWSDKLNCKASCSGIELEKKYLIEGYLEPVKNFASERKVNLSSSSDFNFKVESLKKK